MPGAKYKKIVQFPLFAQKRFCAPMRPRNSGAHWGAKIFGALRAPICAPPAKFLYPALYMYISDISDMEKLWDPVIMIL